jgi:uncharacterized damage-inducible protein DinB
MKEALMLWSKSNAVLDDKINALLAGLGEPAYTQERNTFFKSLSVLHQHILQTYKVYQSVIRTNTKQKYLVSPLTEDSFEVEPSTLAEAADLYRKYNTLWTEFAVAVTDADLKQRFHRTMRNGKVYDLAVEELVVQYMNHTAHHRGQLSQVLDELGVEHDVGGILFSAKEVV